MISTNQLAAALVERTDVDPEMSEFVASHVMDAVTWNADGQPSRPVLDVVDQLRTAFPFAFATTTSSSPRAESSIYNPWKASTRNITMQVRIEAEDPELAAKLKAAAR